MGEYINCCNMNINSKELLLRIYINTSYRKHDGVCFEVHRMEDEEIRLYWSVSLSVSEIIPAIQIIGKQEEYKNMDIISILNSEILATAIKDKLTVNSCILSKEDAELVEELINEGLEENVKKIRGFDGHSYRILIPRVKEEYYESWCIIPIKWGKAANIINLFVKKANLSKDYLPHGLM